MSQINIAHVQAYNAGVTTLYFADQGYVSNSTDTPADTAYLCRMLQPANVQRSMFGGSRTFGKTEIGFGYMTVANSDGALDAIRTYGFDGRSFTSKRGEVTESDGGVPTWTTVIVATLEQVEHTWDLSTFLIRDRQFEINKPVQLTHFGGTNSLPNGLDGVAGDLKGKPIPVLYGTRANIAPPQVNTSRLIYQISAGLVTALTAVRDRALVLTAGVARRLALFSTGSAPLTFTVDTSTDICTTATHSYTTADPVTVTTSNTLPAPLAINTYYYVRVLSSTTFTLHTTAAGATNNTGKVDITTTGTGTQTINNNVTLAGTYDWVFDSTGSYIRLGTQAAGLVTCDASQGATAANRTVAQILKQMLLDAGIASGDITAADVTALDTANSAEVGVYASHENEVTFIAAMDEIAASVGAWYGVDRLGKFRMGVVADPASGSSAVTLTDIEIIELDRIASGDEGNGVPAYRLDFAYAPNDVVQDSDINASVTAAAAAGFREKYRRVSATDASVLTTHLLAPLLTRYSAMIDATAAQTECTRQFGLYSVLRDTLKCKVRLNTALLTLIDLGVVLTIEVARFGYDAGKKFLVIGVQTDLDNKILDLTLWG